MKTSIYSIAEIIRLIKAEQSFEATTEDKSLTIKISKYVPYCCTAIHNGNSLRTDLADKIAIDEFERWYEEDPLTGSFISSLPITIVANDTRFEYDLNRDPQNCIYREAWGHTIWKQKLTKKEEQDSKKKHANYYAIIKTLISKLESMFGACIIYDIHSYNYKRWDREVPLFNIGIENINTNKFGTDINNWITELEQIQIKGITNNTTTNDVFYGRGYNLEFISTNFPNSLVLATEIKKVYCDELSGDIYPHIIKSLQQQLKAAILKNTDSFIHAHCTKDIPHITLLKSGITKNILSVDKALYSQIKSFELLSAINPTNTTFERKRFFRNRFNELPNFKYNPVKINTYNLKQGVLNIPIQSIQDISIRNLYESVIQSSFDKIDLISSLNTPNFLYNSLRYFGRPSKKDIVNAHYILHLPPIPQELSKEPFLSDEDINTAFKKALTDYGLKSKIERSNKILAKVMNTRKKILIQTDARFKNKELHALIEHEIGVHMLTTINSNKQRLKICNLGLPLNTETQEGLAILAEYLSGNISLDRLKKLALRVIIVDNMCNGADFIDCFKLLTNEYATDIHEAFSIVTRVFRGGGFTKDYLYLSGFVKVYKMWENNIDLTPLLVGKTSINFYDTLKEMIARETLSPPQFITKSFVTPRTEKNSSIYPYIISGLR